MSANLSLVPKSPVAADEIADFFRKDLREIVSTHRAMFEKLLFRNEKLPLELADLFEDVGNRYLDISDRISEMHRSRTKTIKRHRAAKQITER